MAKRKIVRIDEEKCNGCGLCIPDCAEGALQIVEGKAKLVTDKFCDGLGACLGHCPQDAITIIEREAEGFDEKAAEHYLHHKKEAEKTKVEPLFAGCPSSRAMQFKPSKSPATTEPSLRAVSELSQWPVQLKLVPVNAPTFEGADLLVVADCVPLAYANFHQDFLKGKAVVVGCPKLDDIQLYREKLTEIFKTNPIRSITVPFMEVPCCFGLVKAIEDALKASGKTIPLKKVKIGIRGDILSEEPSGQTSRAHGIR
jgi:Pyruvate/2-oxoacid:ferredoxin oxidoreductase delta subunit